MLLTTAQEEMAVGYATLYGDMAGGFAPIKDCASRWSTGWRGTESWVCIPNAASLAKVGSAELRPISGTRFAADYDVLDPILEAFIEEDLSVAEITDRGFDRETVIRVLEMVKRNEYKRRRPTPGVRIVAGRSVATGVTRLPRATSSRLESR